MLTYDGQVAVVTGAGNGLGKQYAIYFASRGAKVVVNDLGGSIKGGGGGDVRVADVVVEEIRRMGGAAVANYDPVQSGADIIQTAIQHFGRIDILINNAGILRDTTLKNMKDEDWDILMDVHIHGTLRTTKAAWSYFLRQGYGRIVNTSSSSGIFGNFGQSNYAAAKMAILGLSHAVALEGAHANIHCNILAPSAASRLTATVWSPEMMEAMSPEWVVPLVGFLAHSSCRENGGLFLAGAGHFSKLRWQRSPGCTLAIQHLNADVMLREHQNILDWTQPTAGSGVADDAQGYVSKAAIKPLQGRVALVGVTGTVDDRVHALVLHLSGSGALVIVCGRNADALRRGRGQLDLKVVANSTPLEDSAKIVQDVLRSHGRIDILINYLSPESTGDDLLKDMTEGTWVATFQTHIRSVFMLTRAVWPIFLKSKYGRVVNIASVHGVYGKRSHTILSAAACGVVGFTKTMAREGQKYGILVNAIVHPTDPGAPVSVDTLGPLMVALSCEKAPAAGQLYETAPSWVGALRWQRSGGVDFEYEDGVPSAESVAESFDRICDFDDGRTDYPATPAEGSAHIHTKGTESAKRTSKQDTRAFVGAEHKGNNPKL